MTRARLIAVALGFLAIGFWAIPSMPALAQSKETAEPSIYLTPEEIEEIKKGSACKNLVRQVFELQKQMGGTGRITDFYELKILPADEMVTGKRGRYYSVYLKDAEKKERFQFGGGEYVIASFNATFRRSLTAFVRDVLGVIEGGVEYDLFVRGNASATPFRRERPLIEGFAYTAVDYLPKAIDGQYMQGASKSLSIPSSYNNPELPYLRAAFLQDTIFKFYPIKKPTLLESDISTSRDRGEQFAEILLYVNW